MITLCNLKIDFLPPHPPTVLNELISNWAGAVTDIAETH